MPPFANSDRAILLFESRYNTVHRLKSVKYFTSRVYDAFQGYRMCSEYVETYTQCDILATRPIVLRTFSLEQLLR